MSADRLKLSPADKADLLIRGAKVLAKLAGRSVVIGLWPEWVSSMILFDRLADEISVLRCFDIKCILIIGCSNAVVRLLADHSNHLERDKSQTHVTGILSETIRQKLNRDLTRLVSIGLFKCRIESMPIHGNWVFVSQRKARPSASRGIVVSVDKRTIQRCVDSGKVAIVTSIATGSDGHLYNVELSDAVNSMSAAFLSPFSMVLKGADIKHDRENQWAILSPLIASMEHSDSEGV